MQQQPPVALLAEGVDRNHQMERDSQYLKVALLAEGVDRNIRWLDQTKGVVGSPSSRRAWIEMHA